MSQDNKTKPTTSQRYEDHARKVADQLISLMEKGVAPWQKEWTAGESGFSMPYNAMSGRQYTGGNSMQLMGKALVEGWDDPRWMTFHQIQKAGLKVRKGEKGTQVAVWDFSKVRGSDANQQQEESQAQESEPDTTKYRGPSLYLHTVFNGAQVEGMPALNIREPTTAEWRHNECERLLADSGASIHHNGGDRAFYRPSTDSIHLPAKDAFHSGDAYYSTALHELGHWTGHQDRLNRDLSGRFGSESYAKEELRAEIGSMMIGDRLGIGHDPSRHAAYVQHWIKILKEDPKEIFRAAKDAESICTHLKVESYQHEPIQIRERKQEHVNGPDALHIPKARSGQAKKPVATQEEGARVRVRQTGQETDARPAKRRQLVQSM